MPTARGKTWFPQGTVVYVPVPFALLEVKEYHGNERVKNDDYYGDYAGVLFDPWKKGDLVALELKRG